MALSFYSYSETLDSMNPDMGLFHGQSEVADALLGFCESSDGPHLPIDYLFDSPDELLLVEGNSSPLLSFSQSSLSDPSVLSLPPDLYPPCDEFDLYPCPKRPRSCSDLYDPFNLMCEAKSYKGPIIGSPPSSCRAPEFLPDFVVPAPMMGSLPGCNIEKKASNGCLSAQSVAARERRKRISEKTQELGRLIPGGNKMNTAEMFQAAFKYVKFLQAQVGILRLMGSIQGCSNSLRVDEELQVLLASPSIQEKLSGEGRCIIRKEIIAVLANDLDIKSSPLIFRDLGRFIESMGRSDGCDAKTSM